MNMKTKFWVALIFAIYINGTVNAQKGMLIGDGMAIFYPAKFDSVRNLPSFALVEEPKVVGELPGDWQLKPEYKVVKGKNVVQINIQGDADLYGTGEVTGDLKRNGTNITLWNTDNFAYRKDGGKRLYQSHPWVMGVRKDGTSFGVIADHTWKQSLDLTNGITFTSEGPAFRVIIIERDDPKALLTTLGELTGTIELPPLWALGFQQCRWSYYPDRQVKLIADEFRARKLPCDVIWMDIDYMDGFRVFTFDKKGFPDPKGLNDYLHSKGFKGVYMIDPGVKKDENYSVYQEGTKGNHWVLTKDRKEYNGDVWPGACAFPDYTRPETQKWWASLYKPFMKTGIDGVWNDMNEPAVFDGPDFTMPEDNIHRGGGVLPEDSHLRYHNVYGYLMVRSSLDGIKAANPNLRPFLLTRANFLGGHRYAATWTGDNASSVEHMKMSVPMSINLGLSGQPFNGPDIGGFADNANGELVGQWMALGAFYPFSRNHSAKDAAYQEPWLFGKEIEDVSRIALNRRYILMPFLYTLFHEAATTGLPVMRPVFMADPKDVSLRAEQEAFMWGDDLLIIPSWARNPALPKGNWRTIKLQNIKDGDRYQPELKIREGAIIPAGPVIQNTTEYSIDSLTLLVNVNQKREAIGRLYDDAGNGYDYKNGDYAIYEFKAVPHKKNAIKVSINQIEGKRKTKSVYRIGLVTDKGVHYSDWSDKQSLYIDLAQ
jgi:alpha-glucosidase